LCCGWLGVFEMRTSEVSGLVRSILDHADDTEPDLHRNLLLALAIAADDVNLEPALVQELIARSPQLFPTRVYALGGEVVRYLGRIVANNEEVSEQCLLRAIEAKDHGMRLSAVEALRGSLSAPRVRRLVIDRLSEEDYQVRRAAFEALSGLVCTDDYVREV